MHVGHFHLIAGEEAKGGLPNQQFGRDVLFQDAGQVIVPDGMGDPRREVFDDGFVVGRGSVDELIDQTQEGGAQQRCADDENGGDDGAVDDGFVVYAYPLVTYQEGDDEADQVDEAEAVGPQQTADAEFQVAEEAAEDGVGIEQGPDGDGEEGDAGEKRGEGGRGRGDIAQEEKENAGTKSQRQPGEHDAGGLATGRRHAWGEDGD